MKVEFLAHGAEACPLIRLFAYKLGEVAEAPATFCQLADGKIADLRPA